MKYTTSWIVGASGGIGQAAVEIVSILSTNVCLFDKKEALEKYNRNYYKIDFSDYDSALNCCEDAIRKYGPPQILCFAAGEVISLNFEKTSVENVNSLYNNNFLSLFNALKIFLDCCCKAKSVEKRIVIVSSNAGSVARVNQPVYAAFKAAINSLIKSLAKDFGKYNIRINGIAPGTVIVERNIESLKSKFPNFPYDENRPLPELMYPDSLSSVFTFLLDSTSPITGQILTVDGGSTL